MKFCRRVIHLNAANVRLTSQRSIRSDKHSRPTAVVPTGLGPKPSGFVQDAQQNATSIERIRKQLYMSWRGFSSAHRRAWTNSWMKFTCKLWTRARPSAKKEQGGWGGRHKRLGKTLAMLSSAPLWRAAELDECTPYLQFLCPQPESPTSEVSRGCRGRLPSPSRWPQTLLPRGTLHAHSLRGKKICTQGKHTR